MRISTTMMAAGILLLAGIAPLAAAADGDTIERAYVLGGAHAEASWPSDPGTVASRDEAAGAATCTGPATAPPMPATGWPGGACFHPAAFDTEQVEVTVTHAYATAPPTSASFAAGYDVDGDGCVGCTSVDRLWTGTGSTTLPLVEDAGRLAVFVHGLSGDTDPTEPPTTTTISLTGTVAVTPLEGDHACEDAETTPEACGIVSDDPRPHLCLPDCGSEGG